MLIQDSFKATNDPTRKYVSGYYFRFPLRKLLLRCLFKFRAVISDVANVAQGLTSYKKKISKSSPEW
jgi:hypothetical protein